MSDSIAPVALGLAFILAASKVGGHVALRLGQVAVLGELAAGIVLGNLPATHALDWLRSDPSIDLFARFGALLVLFDVGLELTVREVLSVGRAAAQVAVLGSVFSLVAGTGVAGLLRPRASGYEHVFLGAALTATSVGITARTLKELGKTRNAESRVILGAAVLDDVIGLLVLTLVTGFEPVVGGQGHVAYAALAWTVAKAVGFFGFAFAVGARLAPMLFAASARLRGGGAQVAVGLVLCFSFAWLADALGLAPIIGAFVAGLIVEDEHSAHFVRRGERPLRELVEPVSSFLVPIFFTVMGARVDLAALAHGAALGVALALTAAAVAGKLACALGARGVRRLPVAMGMVPRGEVTILYAGTGAALVVSGKPVLEPALYSALVFVVMATTFVAPAAIKWSFARGEEIPAGPAAT